MRVLHVTTSWPRSPQDTAGRFVAALVAAQAREGLDVGVVHPGTSGSAGVLGWVRSPMRWPLLMLTLLRLGWRVRRAARGVDVVHAHWWPCATVAIVARRGRPVVVTMHGSDVFLAGRSRIARRIAKWTLVRCVARVAVSPSLAAKAQSMTSVPCGAVIANGDSQEDPATHPLADPTARPLVVFAGSLERHKGADLLPAIAAELQERGVEVPIDVYGAGSLEESLRSAPDVRCHGAVSHARLMELCRTAAAVVVCPSHEEGFGLVAHEAACRGAVVVATDTGGLHDQFASSEVHLLVRALDAGLFADAIAVALADDERRVAAVTAARAGATNARTWDQVAADYLVVYEGALALSSR